MGVPLSTNTWEVIYSLPAVSPNPYTLNPKLYRVTSLIRNSASLGSYSRAMPRALWWS